MTRPRGRPPTPRATSRAMELVGITAICITGRSPRRITEPLPNCLSICASASSSAFSRSGAATIAVTPVFDFAFFATADTVCGGYDKNPPPYRGLWMAEPLWTIAEHLYDIERHAR